MPVLRTYILFLVIALLPHTADAQAKDYSAVDIRAKRAPLGVAVTYKALTQYLIQPYTDEANKVRSISIWIMHNIRYDVSMYVTDKRKKLTPNQILRRRKAICQGYSDLFEAMCIEAGVEVATVTGYDKGGFYEPTDIFVRADHSWNAVKINGNWRLIDLSWSGGTIVLRKQRIRKFFARILKIPYKFKYKFVQKPNFKYYLADPEEFVKDHLPAHPGWQLTDRIIPIEVFEQDTTVLAAFLKSNTGEVNPFNASADYYQSLQYPEGYLTMGNIAHKFNEQNFRILAEGEALFCYNWYTETEKSDMTPEEKIEIYDSCRVLVRMATKDMRNYVKFTRKEKLVRSKKNKAFKKDSHNFNKQSIREITRQKKDNIRYRKQAKRQLDKLRREQSVLKKEIGVIRHKSIGLSKKEMKPDSIVELSIANYVAKSKSNKESIDLLKSSNKVLVTDVIADLHQNILDRIGDVSMNCTATDSIIWSKISNRLFFYWTNKHIIDSLQVDHLREREEKISSLKSIRSDYKGLLQTMNLDKKRTREVRRYYNQQLINAKRANKKSNDSLLVNNIWPKDFTTNQDEWIDYNKKRIALLENYQFLLKTERNAFVRLVNQYRKEYKNNKKERVWERLRYSGWMRYYIRFYIREKRKAIKYNRSLKSLDGSIKKSKEKCKKEIAKREKKQDKEDMRRLKANR